MASRSQNSSRYVSTKRSFVVGRNSQPADKTITKDADNNQTASGSTVSHSNLIHNQNKSPTQNYSSRNSLRAAQSNTDKNVNIFERRSRPTDSNDMLGARNQCDNLFERHINYNTNYELLNSDLFLRFLSNEIYCMLCGTKEIAESSNALDKHLISEKHNLNYCNLRITLLDQLPKRDSLQMQAVKELLIKWFRSQSLNQEAILSRLEIINQFNSVLAMVNPECQLRIFGSLMTGTSLISSDINLELIHPNSKLFEKDPRAKNSIHHKLIDPDAAYGFQINNHALHYDLIPNAIDTLYTIMNVMNTIHQDPRLCPFTVTSDLNDLNRKVPRLVLKHIATGTALEVCCYAGSSFKLSVFLNSYLSLDERARELSLLVRYWAKICNIDKPEQGTFPADAFIILTIYYLQRVSPPVLPCLHELLSKGSKSEMTNGNYENSISKEFNKLDLLKSNTSNLKTEQVGHGIEAKHDTEATESCLEQGEEELEDEEDEDGDSIEFSQEDIENIRWSSANKLAVHELFIDFLSMLMKEFNDSSNVISIRTLKTTSLQTKCWATQIKAIENPLRPKLNISRCIGTIRTFEYIRNCFRYGYYYLTSMPIHQNLKRKEEHQLDPRNYSDLYLNLDRFEQYFKMRAQSLQVNATYSPINEMVKQNLFARDAVVTNALFDKAVSETDGAKLLPMIVANSFQESLLVPKDIQSTIYCGFCRRNGHIKSNCPKAKIENLQVESESYEETLDDKVNFDKIFFALYKNDAITSRQSATHQEVVQKLESIINQSTGLGCSLQLFGSTVNNLGSRDSDLDICMTIAGNLTGKGVDCVKVLEEVLTVLNKVRSIRLMQPILSARVPILKFNYERFEVDLSMYNQCATYNSELLKAYSMIDERVSQLFYLVKKYAKGCGIADASRGSLSSYAWSLMVIHYLQRTNPPILPVLQEPDSNMEKQMIGINGWNVWFKKKVPPAPVINHITLTRLFKEFFLYYGNFDFNFYVVSIRRLSPITRFQKNWNHCMMAIEDPFELTYNLASRLDDAMATYIINSFSQAYRHIVRIQEKQLKQHEPFETPKNFVVTKIFYGKDITGSGPPYRGCRLCHRIGHKYVDCPDRKGRFVQRPVQLK